MGNLGSKASVIFDDLRNSWYFRIYAFTWLFCALMAFIALIIIGQRSNQNAKDPTWHLWVENAAELQFPDFFFKIPPDEIGTNTIQAAFCQWGRPDDHPILASTAVCEASGEPLSQCVFVYGSEFAANQDFNALDCQLNITGAANTDRVVTLQIYQGAAFGPSITWIQPSSNAVVQISKIEFKPKGVDTQVVWRSNLQYHTTVASADYFHLRIVFENFAVVHWDESSGQQWWSVGAIGGFAFFMVILHTIFMAIIEMCLPNDSRFLKGGNSGSASEYQPVK